MNHQSSPLINAPRPSGTTIPTDGLELLFFPDAGWCPNNRLLPVLVYRCVSLSTGEELALEFESLFEKNEWKPAWRQSIFDYPHYHSTTHEVLGVFQGEAYVRLGDRTGVTMRINAGDVLFIPAGVSHQCISASAGFCCVGAYPAHSKVDEQRPENSDRSGSDFRIGVLPVPGCDPVFGGEGPLRKLGLIVQQAQTHDLR